MDLLDVEVPPDLMELLDFKEPKDQLESMAQLVHKEHVVPLDPPDLLESKEFKALVVCKDLMVSPDLLDHLDLEEPQEPQD